MRRFPFALVATFATIAFCGCATTRSGTTSPTVRAATASEKEQISWALGTLWTADSSLRLPSGCKVGLGVVRDTRVNAAVAEGSECAAAYSLSVTEGALQLPSGQLRAMLAHELGHVRLGHRPAAKNRRANEAIGRTIGDTMVTIGSVVPNVGVMLQLLGYGVSAGTALVARAYDRSQEDEADAFAASLLSRIGPTACTELAEMFRRLSGQDGGWLSTHPSASNRSEQSEKRCREPESTVATAPTVFPAITNTVASRGSFLGAAESVYLASVEGRINVQRSSWAMTDDRRVEAEVRVSTAGELESAEILVSSGDASADADLLRAIRNAAPFRASTWGGSFDVRIIATSVTKAQRR